MTEREALDQLEDAFPTATKVAIQPFDFGSKMGVAVQFGVYPNVRRNAVKYDPRTHTIADAIEKLQAWVAEQAI